MNRDEVGKEEDAVEVARRTAESVGNPSPLFVLVLASNPRSGSTLLSELLATVKDSVLFFEPSWPYRNAPEFVNGRNVSDYLSNIFKCDYSDKFESWLKSEFSFNQYYHPSVLQCYSQWNAEECLKELDLRSLCQNAQVRIAKVVRVKLSWVEELLENSSFNIKVIHLMRDPRGSITSMQGLYWDWKPSEKCGNLWQDMQDYDRLLQSYPFKLTNVTHEELSLDPIATIERINLFLYGHSDLSSDTKRYIKKHTNASKYQGDNMSTYKVSSEQYQSWRWKINGRLLSNIESVASCRSAIARYGHNIFESLDRVTDPRIPLEVSVTGTK